MSHKAERMAEAVAGATSRRGFLGTLGRAAGAAALALGGLAARPAHAGREHVTLCCWYARWSPVYGYYDFSSRCAKNKCPKHHAGGGLVSSEPVSDCSVC